MRPLSELCPHLSPKPMERPWGGWVRKTRDPLLLRWWRRVYVENRNIVAIAHGPPGSGKSTSCLSLCEMFDPNFSERNIVFNVKDFVALLLRAESGDLPPGSAVLFEESGVAADARSWHSDDNIQFSHILQTFRPLRIALFNTVPDLTLADRRLSQLASCLIHARGVNRTRQTTTVRIYDPVSFNPKTAEWTKHSVSFSRPTPGGRPRTYRYGDVSVRKPSRRTVELYEKARAGFSRELLDKAGKVLADQAAPRPERSQLTPERIDALVSEIILDRDRYMRTEPGVGITRFDIGAVQAKNPELGAPNCRVVKSAVRQKLLDMGFVVQFR